MATHDYVIDNSTGANVRADINSVLQAILTNNSSSSAPSTTAAYMFWADTTSGTLKIRNSSDNAWVELLQLDGTLTLEDGSASTPGLAFRDDLNTGIFSSAADTFNIATGGVERMELGATTIFNEGGADVDFRIEGDTKANLFYVDAGNDRIGINTSSPNTLLELSGGGNTTLTINTGNSSGDNSQIAFGDSADANVGFINYDHGTNAMQFRVNASERFRVDSIGNFLIGASSSVEVGSSAEAQLQVTQASDGSRLGLSLISIFNGSSPAAILALGHGRGSTSGALQDNDVLGQIRFAGGDGTDCQTIGADIKAEINGTPGSNDMPTDLVFSTNSGGASPSERMRIASSGNVFIGKTASDVSDTGVELMQNGESAFTRNNGSTCKFNRGTNNGILISLRRSGIEGGTIGITTTSASFNTSSSDRSLKKNFEAWTENTLDLFKNLNPQKFNYIVEDDGAEKTKGYIAQDLIDSFPEAYPKNDDGKYLFNPSGMVVYLMKAIQELQAKVETLEAA